MDGDFKGDFTRDSFSKLSQFTRVLMQQGRVQLDADWNEQADILLYALRTLITDLVGPHWGTIDARDISITVDKTIPKITITTAKDTDSTNSFKIQPPPLKGSRQDFVIGKGHYYVDGILCENRRDDSPDLTYLTQKSSPQPIEDGQYLVYLDVWERQITALEDENIREVALGNGEPDTATRAQVVWQVRAIDAAKSPFTIVDDDIKALSTEKIQKIEDWTKKLQSQLQPDQRGELKAWGKVAADQEINACIIPSEARYRGAENQLYRVEIHKGGKDREATFKWSRENGSIVFPILPPIEGETVTLGALGREDRLSLHEGDWVEVGDDAYILQVSGNISNDAQVHPLRQVKIVDRLTGQVTLSEQPNITIKKNEPTRHPLLRRWDQKTSKENAATEDGITIKEDTPIPLEDGIQIQFQVPGKNEPPNLYRVGDYWLIPARTATGDVIWPQETDEKGKSQPKSMPPNGVEHHYALLALVTVQDLKVTQERITDLRYVVPPLAKVMAAIPTTLVVEK